MGQRFIKSLYPNKDKEYKFKHLDPFSHQIRQNLHFVSGVRPHCRGEPQDIGFMRDVVVDVVARNFYNTLGIAASSLCEELANIRTSTCFIICFKLKRAAFRNNEALNQVVTKAEALVEHLIDSSKTISVTDNDGYVIFECIEDAESRLVNSGAAAEDSKIILVASDGGSYGNNGNNQLEDLKNFFNKGNQSDQHQKRIRKNDASPRKKGDSIYENEDFVTLMKKFITNFEAENETKISAYEVVTTIAEPSSMSGIIRLKFEYGKDGDTATSTIILKIPSIVPLYHKVLKNMNMYDREAHIYETVLPALYQLGRCEPFAPKLYAVTQTKAMVLEDLKADGYERVAFMFLDLEHSQIALKVLAKYHALGYIYLQNLNKDHPSMSLLGTIQPTIKNVISKEEFNAFCKLVKPALERSLYKKIMGMKDQILADLATVNNIDKNSMTVIIHGDFHSRNILFKYNSEGKVYQAKIIDWQFSREANPMLDLIEFCVVNIHEELFEDNENNLLDSYLETLNHHLSLLSTKREYNRQELDNDLAFFKYHYFRALAAIGPGGLVMSPQFKKPIRQMMAKWIQLMEKKGFI